MTCWSCGLALPEEARFCARCGVRQRVAGAGAPAWLLAVFGVGAAVAAVAGSGYAIVLLDPGVRRGSPQEVQLELTFAWIVVVYAATLVALQLGALAGFASGRDWGRLLATLACLLWCLTGFGLLISFPILYHLWRPRPVRR